MSFNSLFGLGSHSPDADLLAWWPLQDDAASTTVVNQIGADGTLNGGSNTQDLSGVGPNSWATKSLEFLYANYVETGIAFTAALRSAGKASFLVRCNTGTLGTFGEYRPAIGERTSVPSGGFGFGFRYNSGNKIRWTSYGIADYDSSTVTLDGSWASYASAYGTASVSFYKNGSLVSSVAATTPNATDGSETATLGAISNLLTAAAYWLDSSMADASLWDRKLDATDIDEWDKGPEPVNSVAPTISGTESVGSSLSCTSGTWGLDAPFSAGSNGTITYAYQWTRSDDGTGTNEADISGATSSSYTLVAGDLAKYIRCRVAATNDGGHDSSADTNSNFTGAISGGGGGGFQAAWATIARRNSIIGGGV